ncbi:hypothetical protein GJ744_002500 [Endocarpon pusillum]|uniref:Uncharacterized protein n=1 Tax=Endocarpon pusillum TaxID=364733 RepID=A0A8H7E2N7_9EURO|nr:hypothetical protein GJ744_002500 [Endocarpon pusillum]
MPGKRVTKTALIPAQDKENIDPATLSRKMQQSRDRRKIERRNQLQARFDGSMAAMDKLVEEQLERAVDESTTVRVDFTTRLMELFKRRGEIEAQIISGSEALERAYYAANSELREVLKGKLEDINNGLKEPEAIQPDNLQS